ncbi:unnamed protein product [Closterium sp. Naga37s-1]|nr:unnamed protein product [Closterium sp. Naga37s-1]
MRRGVDYSKWDHIGSGSDEEEDEHRGPLKRDTSRSGAGTEPTPLNLVGTYGAGRSELKKVIWLANQKAMRHFGGFPYPAVRATVETKVPGRVGGKEEPRRFQLLSGEDMVHYLDVRGGWDQKECDCCFDRAVSLGADRAVTMESLEFVRSLLHKRLPDATPFAPCSNGVNKAVLEFSAGVQAFGEQGEVASPRVQFSCKETLAPFVCVEGMLLEWMTEPRVGVLMDLGRIRSRLPAILANDGSFGDHPAASAASASTAASPAAPAAAATWSCWRCSRCWAAYRCAVSFTAFLVLVARWPRVDIIWKAHLDTYDAVYPALAGQLGVGRQGREDPAASMLVKVLGVKESADLQEGFGFFVQHVLSGGLEKAHAEGRGKGRAAGNTAEKAEGMGSGQAGEKGRTVARKSVGLMGQMGQMWQPGKMGKVGQAMAAMVQSVGSGARVGSAEWLQSMDEFGVDVANMEDLGALLDGAGAMGMGLPYEVGGWGGSGKEGVGGEDPKGEKWREHLKGREWERYVDGMAWILEHGGGEGREFWCSHCSEGGSSVGSSSSSSSGGVSSVVEGSRIPKGMYVSGVGATDFALAVASVFSMPEHRKLGAMLFGGSQSTTSSNVHDAAIEEARERLRKQIVTSGKVAKGMDEDEGGETEGGVEAAASAALEKGQPGPSADPLSARAGSADYSSVSAAISGSSSMNSSGMRSPGLVPVNTDPSIGLLTYRVARLLQWLRIYGSDLISAKSCFKDSPQGKVLPMRHPLRNLPSLLVRFGAVLPPLDGSTDLPEWEEWPEGDEASTKFPEDSSARCFRLGRADGRQDHTNSGNGEVQQGSFPEAFTEQVPPLESGESRPIVCCRADADLIRVLARLGLDSSLYAAHDSLYGNRSSSSSVRALRERVEQVPLAFLLDLALMRATLLLKHCGTEDGQNPKAGGRGSGVKKEVGRRAGSGDSGEGKGGRKDADEGDCGVVWEEVQSWFTVAMMPASRMGEGVPACCDGQAREKDVSARVEVAKELHQLALLPSFHEDMKHGGGIGSFSKRKGKKGEEPAYLKAWPGGVNLVACLREMLLGEPCYRPASPATPSSAASSTAAPGNSSSDAACTVAAPRVAAATKLEANTGSHDRSHGLVSPGRRVPEVLSVCNQVLVVCLPSSV